MQLLLTRLIVAILGLLVYDRSQRRHGMRLVLTLPLIVAFVGLLVYALSSNGKVAEVGRVAWAVGLLAFLFGLK